MSFSKERVPRPDFGLYDPEIPGNSSLYILLSVFSFIFTISYTLYLIIVIYYIVQNPFVTAFFNLLALMLEGFIAYYAIIMLTHLAKGFAPVNGQLDPIVQLEDVKKGEVPSISILLSCYKEPLSIVKQSLKAAMDMNWPTQKYEIAVMEDGIENDKVKNYCIENGIHHFNRGHRDHFKAGAVNYALPKLTGDYVLFIDADHILERNIIINCLRAWRKNTIGVQTRVDFVNMVTFLTRVSAFLQILFFSLLERGRRSTGSAIFAGGGALFDRHKLIAAGGMNELTIADDTDTSFTLIADGHRIEYIDTVGVWALVPWDPIHQIRQVWRWFTGITRSWRARWFTILKSRNTGFYIKVDHFFTGFLPTLTVIGWFMGVIYFSMILTGLPFARLPSTDWSELLGLIPSATTSLAGITGIVALWLDHPDVLYRKERPLKMITALGGYYMLLVAAQPLLIGAVFKGLTGIHVEFNRTPKKKQSTDDGLYRIKLHYFFYTVIIFVIGLVYLVASTTVPWGDPRQLSLLIVSYSSILPLIIALIWFWKLEAYLEQVGEISALEFLAQLSKKIA